MKIKVSVIIPFFNNISFLKRAIKSVLNQTYRNYEIIIINDKSKKVDLFHVKNFIKNKSKIKLINNKKNIGPGLSRNKGIKIAKGKYVAFLDSDDIWTKNKLLLQIKLMEKKKYLITHTTYDVVDVEKNFIQKRMARDLDYKDLLNSCDIGLSTVIIVRKLLTKNLFPNLKTKEDYVLWLKIAKKGIIFNGLDKTFTKWTNRPGSLSKSVYQKLKDAFVVYNKFERLNFFVSLTRVMILSLNFIKKR